MKTALVLAGLTALNAAYHLRPAPEPAPIDPVSAENGVMIDAAYLPGVQTSCTLLVFFDPSCPFCGAVADAHAELDGYPIDVVWITDDPLGARGYQNRIPEGADLLISRPLVELLGVEAVPAGVWVEEGRMVASGALVPSLTAADLAAPCATD